MPKRPIIVMPSASRETQFSLDTALSIVNWFRANGYNPLTLHGLSTLRPGVESIIREVKATEDSPHFLVYVGHGHPGDLLGVKPIGERFRILRPVVADEPFANAEILEGFIVYAVACDTLSDLGPEVIQKGGVAYIGDRTPLHLLFSDLDNDNIPDFLELYTAIPRALGEGASTGNAFSQFRSEAQSLRMYAAPGSQEAFILDDTIRNFGLVGSTTARWV